MQTPTQRLMRSRDDKMIAGVAGGIARYLAIDSVIVRLVFVLTAFSGIGLLIYPLLWLLMPLAPEMTATTTHNETSEVFVAAGSRSRRVRLDPMTGQSSDPDQEIPIQNVGSPSGDATDAQTRRNRTLGFILLGIGVFFMLQMIPYGWMQFVIPALLIVGGIWLLRRST
ncbi:MAG: PspC domain-containing protein [Chloroflexales bacterium]|nr:PspC domain-containing protein [Chloroflexales bacterium]